jgi:hypothetical protein
MLRFPLSRQIDRFQKMTFVDAFYQPYSYDKVMLFSMCPPELKFVRHIKMYYVWFERDKQSFDVGIKKKTIIDRWKDMLRFQLKKCPWIDSSGHIIRLQMSATKAILEYIKNSDPMHRTNNFGKEYTEKHNMFQDLNDVCTNSEFSRLHPRSMKRLSNLFLTTTTESLPFPWFRPVKPSMTDRFLVHLLLSMGSFTTEFELFHYADFKQCFIAAQLFTTSSDLDDQKKSCYKLVQTYFKEQLLSMPLANEF